MQNLFVYNNSKYIVAQTNTQPTLPPEIQSNQTGDFEALPYFSLIFPAIVVSIFVFVFGIMGYAIFKGISTAAYNRKQPIINREAKVVSKRQNVSGGGNSSTSTSYYITFEFADGSREEFSLSGREYALIAEGDKGTLYSQGSWYKEFKRQF